MSSASGIREGSWRWWSTPTARRRAPPSARSAWCAPLGGSWRARSTSGATGRERVLLDRLGVDGGADGAGDRQRRGHEHEVPHAVGAAVLGEILEVEHL